MLITSLQRKLGKLDNIRFSKIYSLADKALFDIKIGSNIYDWWIQIMWKHFRECIKYLSEKKEINEFTIISNDYDRKD
jgi:pyruvate-formate lyase-activating enzyme